MRNLRRLFPTLLGVSLLLAAGMNYQVEGQRWWSHIQALANDQMEGRDTGSQGHRKAAAYVAGEFERDGLKAAGTQGYIQPVKFAVSELDEGQSSVKLIANGNEHLVKLGEEAMLSMRGDIQPHTKAGAVFVGYGMRVPEKQWDDLAGLDLHGKIAVVLTGGPAAIGGPMRAHYQSAGERWKALKAAGAVGTASILNPSAMDIPWARMSLSRFQPAMSLAEPGLNDTDGLGLNLVINPNHGDVFLEGTGHTISELLKDADAEKPLPHFPLKVAIDAIVKVKRSEVESQNVAGMLTGSDSRLKNEYVVVSAHLDHVGVGKPINGDSIYNGAMDDASGIASILEIAKMLKESNVHTNRSIVFLAVTGEEKGLLGSKYFTHHPTVPEKDIVADINLDMFLPLHALRYLEVQGLGESTLGDDVRAVAHAAGVMVQADKEPQRNLFIRSDQYSFIRKGVPAVAFKFGYLPGSPEEKLHKTWLTERYHAPSDDLNQPVDKAAAARFNEIILRLAERVADAPGRPQWKPDSFFRRFATT